jgi:hypothetical protein
MTGSPPTRHLGEPVRRPASAGTLVPVEVWGFIWLMLVLKIPVAALLWLVWWAVRQTPEPATEGDEGEGGSGRPLVPHPHGGPRLPPHRRPRGPHGDPQPPAPSRCRTPARSREPVER